MNHFMFDIDGTLVESYAFDSECFVSAVSEVINIEIASDWSQYSHVTDSGILLQILEEYHILNQQRCIELIKRRFLQKINSYINQNPVKQVIGASFFIESLMCREDTTISFATGGWYESAILKLKSAGINFSDIPIASSNDHFDRSEIMKLAAERASVDSDCVVTYFGDGSWDKEACEKQGFNFILVGNKLSYRPRITNFESIGKLLVEVGL